MRKLILFLAALAVFTLVSGFGTTAHDASELVPVQALVIDAENGQILVTADTADTGRGTTLDAAFSDFFRENAGNGPAGAFFVVQRRRMQLYAIKTPQTCSAVPRAISVKTCPVTGEGLVKYWPLAGGRYSPPM